MAKLFFYMQGGKLDPAAGNNVGVNSGSWDRYRSVECTGFHSTYGQERLWFDTENEALKFGEEYGCDPTMRIDDTDAALSTDREGHLITTIGGVKYYWSDWGIILKSDDAAPPEVIGEYPAFGSGRLAEVADTFERAAPWGTDGSTPLEDDEEADVTLTGADIRTIKAILARAASGEAA